ncbi:chromosomal replication initiator protein DnaA, partial [Aeromicrobium sp.]|nr:chromosomal replication initiator protein DnaA [Candidatus Saccharibacteria bacterium]
MNVPEGGATTVQQAGLWQAVLGEIELSVSRGNFMTWFKNTELASVNEDSVVIAVPNIFIKQQLERKYGDLLNEVMKKNGIVNPTIVYKIAAAGAARKTEEEPVFVAPSPAAPKNSPAAELPLPKSTGLAHSYRQGINDRYTFENFIVGSGNELAFAACQSIAVNPGTKYNPLFLYGGVGIGKTHLIQAVGNAVLANNPRAKVLYISSEQFVQELVDAIRFKKTADFASYYRTTDVLIVDDVQFIAGKEKMQEEFFHTFNALHQANKQIILTSDKPPRDIGALEDRLRSRFTWGMSIDMQIPDFETRCAIVQTKAHSQDME